TWHAGSASSAWSRLIRPHRKKRPATQASWRFTRRRKTSPTRRATSHRAGRACAIRFPRAMARTYWKIINRRPACAATPARSASEGRRSSFPRLRFGLVLGKPIGGNEQLLRQLHRLVGNILPAPGALPADGFDRRVGLQLGGGNRRAERRHSQHPAAGG